MRPVGRLHIGDYLGTLKTWLRLQQESECYFFIADWHGLATSYQDTSAFRQRVHETLIDWLAVGIDPHLATVFVQSRVAECAELNLLLSMCTPVSWLERVAAARAAASKEAVDAVDGGPLSGDCAGGSASLAPGLAGSGVDGVSSTAATAGTDCITLGQLAYPLLQACDILLYRPTHVYVPADQAPHAEIARDVARRFNHLFGRETDNEVRVKRALKRLGRSADTFLADRRAFQERGEEPARLAGLRLLEEAPGLTVGDRARLVAYLEGGGRSVLGEPEAELLPSPDLAVGEGRGPPAPRDVAIALRDGADAVQEKFRRMPTDPARVRRGDPGTPEKCPVWRYHVEFGDLATLGWVREGCEGARIGCKDCKERAAESTLAALAPVRQAAREFEENPEVVRSIVVEGSERARDVARETMVEVRRAMSLDQR